MIPMLESIGSMIAVIVRIVNEKVEQKSNKGETENQPLTYADIVKGKKKKSNSVETTWAMLIKSS